MKKTIEELNELMDNVMKRNMEITFGDLSAMVDDDGEIKLILQDFMKMYDLSKKLLVEFGEEMDNMNKKLDLLLERTEK